MKNSNPFSTLFYKRTPSEPMQEIFRGCLVGGAVGDALGAAVEFDSLEVIQRKYGASGINDYAVAYGRLGAITDDTQMTLFTAEGVIRAYFRMSRRGLCNTQECLKRAYLRWYETQGYPVVNSEYEREMVISGWLIQQQGLFATRAPGNTCLSALGFWNANKKHQNNSKGCGAVMRVAPIGLFFSSLHLRGDDNGNMLDESHCADQCYDMAVESSALTHHHKTSDDASAAFAIMIYYLALGHELDSALQLALQMLEERQANNETTDALKLACMLANDDTPMTMAIQQLGEGWIAEEALAIAVYCALKTNNFNDGMIASVNHSGDSDSTGSIAGQLMGIMYGYSNIPTRFLADLELKALIIEVADDVANAPDWPMGSETNQEYIDMWQKYPPN